MLWLIFGMACALLLAAIALRVKFARLSGAEGPDSTALPPDPATPLATAVAGLSLPEGQNGLTGISDGLDAFAARIALIRAAQSALDVQYYVWHKDRAGQLMLNELRAAVARGVRLRLLVDDLGAPDLDDILHGLNSLPGAEVRLFNPFLLRRMRTVNLLLDFGRLNRRMHNKSLTADGVACILGGRNIGDEYFEGGKDFHFIDFDVLLTGPAAAEVAADFDIYWASAAAVPVTRLLRHPPGALDRLKAQAETIWQEPDSAAYAAALDDGNPVQDLLDGRLQPHHAPVQLVSDDPVKATGRAKRKHLLASRLAALLSLPETSADFITAYFVPGGRGLRALTAMAKRGVRIRVLTNGQQSTDVGLVHCGYARYRRRLLRAGISVYELKAGLGQPKPRRRRRLRRVLSASSGNSLHAKTFVIDGRQIFVGSFNLDQRSVFLNTELGLLIDSPGLSAEVSEALDQDLAENAYRLFLKKDGTHGALRWVEPTDTGEVTHITEPGTTLFSRTLLRLAGRLPIEWLL